MQIIETACDDVRMSARLKKVLKTILKVGNQLNDGEVIHIYIHKYIIFIHTYTYIHKENAHLCLFTYIYIHTYNMYTLATHLRTYTHAKVISQLQAFTLNYVCMYVCMCTR